MRGVEGSRIVETSRGSLDATAAHGPQRGGEIGTEGHSGVSWRLGSCVTRSPTRPISTSGVLPITSRPTIS